MAPTKSWPLLLRFHEHSDLLALPPCDFASDRLFGIRLARLPKGSLRIQQQEMARKPSYDGSVLCHAQPASCSGISCTWFSCQPTILRRTGIATVGRCELGQSCRLGIRGCWHISWTRQSKAFATPVERNPPRHRLVRLHDGIRLLISDTSPRCPRKFSTQFGGRLSKCSVTAPSPFLTANWYN